MSKNTYSVTELNKYIERLFQDDFLLANLTITGEVSNCKYNHTGHIYFTLKDDQSSISCVMFNGNRLKGLKFNMKDGDQVTIKGYCGIYAAAGKYQVYARSIELAGVGDLYLRFEALKQELEEAGMFADMYKKPIPQFATKVGIVTAPTGAAVRDIIRVSQNRNPYVQLYLYPAQVQGEAATESICRGLRALDQMGLDVIICGRGGGSIEDLWAFNEAAVARCIFNCNTPVISAVGHETDFTIADFVADKRAATPTHAAELANFDYAEFMDRLSRYSDRMNMSLDNRINNYTEKLVSYRRQLNTLRPENKIRQNEERLKTLKASLLQAMSTAISSRENKLAVMSGRLEATSPLKKLSAGFGYVAGAEGQRIESVQQVQTGDTIITRLLDGQILSTITEITNNNLNGD